MGPDNIREIGEYVLRCRRPAAEGLKKGKTIFEESKYTKNRPQERFPGPRIVQDTGGLLEQSFHVPGNRG